MTFAALIVIPHLERYTKKGKNMKSIILTLTIIFLIQGNAFSKVESDGFDVEMYYSATKEFDIKNEKSKDFQIYLEGNFNNNSSSSMTFNKIETKKLYIINHNT